MDGTVVGKMPAPEEYGQHIARLNAESVQHRQRLDAQEKHLEEVRANYVALASQQAATKSLIEGLHARFEGLDTRLFGVFQQMTRDNAQLLQEMTKASSQERKDGHKERTTAQKGWLGFAKYVVGGTIAALVTYIFTRG